MTTVNNNNPPLDWRGLTHHHSSAAVYLHIWSINHSSLVLQSRYPSTAVAVEFLGRGKIGAHCKVAIINTAEEEIRNTAPQTGYLEEGSPLFVDLGYTSDFITFVNKNLPDDILRLRVEVTILESSSSPAAFILNAPQGSSLKDDFVQAWGDREFADLIIIAGEKRFHVHKVVLATRSPVFRAMLKNDMQESIQNEVVLKDVYPDVVQEMLRFIYTDASPNISTMAADLYQLADKYDLKGLKLLCESELASSLSVDTVVDVLRLADKLQCDTLKKLAVLYINAHATDVGMTDGWKRMVKEEVRLVECFITDGLKVV
ncbi:speckle-type POZ protein B-like [Ornithodoros turicata]|uniref:speckle-type POZ protein B-like n=1 Tax=Ornithodoros turicata TaxID=34597 RepID=UPI00313A4364